MFSMKKKPKPAPGPIGAAKLRNLYGCHHTLHILEKQGFIRLFDEGEENGKRRQARYLWLRDAPTALTFKRLRDKAFTRTVDEWQSKAYAELESLKEELEEWFGNLTDALQQTDKGQEVEQAAEALSWVENEPEIPDTIKNDKMVFVPPPMRSKSRSSRCAQAIAILSAVKAHVEEVRDEEASVLQKDDIAALTDYANELEEHIGEAENAEFPSAY